MSRNDLTSSRSAAPNAYTGVVKLAKARCLDALVLMTAFDVACAEHSERVEPIAVQGNSAEPAIEPRPRSTAALECAAEHPGAATDPAMMQLVGKCMQAFGDSERCNPERLLSAEAATCIAWARGVREGVAPPRVTAFGDHRGLFWRIETTTDQAFKSQSGESWTVDAHTGELAQALGWGEHGF